MVGRSKFDSGLHNLIMLIQRHKKHINMYVCICEYMYIYIDYVADRQTGNRISIVIRQITHR